MPYCIRKGGGNHPSFIRGSEVNVFKLIMVICVLKIPGHPSIVGEKNLREVSASPSTHFRREINASQYGRRIIVHLIPIKPTVGRSDYFSRFICNHNIRIIDSMEICNASE